ncbi:MAG: septal ring lytic transglycosylase RlpA family protein [Nitrospinaceae bacterium]|jgi:rare lipoprotein A|nr:septal ring lytic transglycosylase RlpA family protein [Nitrospinaceae bacterium]MBT3435663.1 septal ring lytic transglycosylase RlpA family protein [Nitrospinaceae bacterium]MBT4092591.1 septal ring lytic transglycosylase RlpA family protein [Nitrospinaceae bacterium]MBT5946301.1 septal ring lytic transglycosylase RlpA family protein [Nitrospinaceae bacterium]MBT6395577.1 septal ring lytic transglycosylase RlpA family protein [Nitrospinaceae bacterium]
MFIRKEKCVPSTRRRAAAYLAVILLATLAGCASAPDRPRAVSAPVPSSDLSGLASWYGQPYHGRKTANGETYDMYDLTAAHRTLPFGARVRVERTDTGRHVNVRINDRGPFVKGRVIDLSQGAADRLGMRSKGVARVRLIPLRMPPKKRARWLILVGNFRTRGEAEKFTGAVSKRARKTRVIPGWHGDRNRYRVQLEGFTDRRRAADLTGQLRGRGYDAYLVRVG